MNMKACVSTHILQHISSDVGSFAIESAYLSVATSHTVMIDGHKSSNPVFDYRHVAMFCDVLLFLV